MRTILDDAEARIAPAVTTAQAGRQAQIDAMRQEIGPSNYAQAPGELAKLEAFIGKEIRPFLAQLRTIEQRAKSPLPQHMQAHLKEIDTLCDSTPRTVRAGIDAWHTLQPPIWAMDGKSVDDNARKGMIQHIRFCLRNWDGVRGRRSNRG